MSGTEKGIEQAIIHYIQAIGAWATPIQCGSVMKQYRTADGRIRQHKINLSTPGTPDVLACIKGKFVGIEVKKDAKEVKKWFAYPKGLRGKPVAYDSRTEAQKHQRELIRASGGIHIICCSVDELESDLRSVGLI